MGVARVEPEARPGDRADRRRTVPGIAFALAGLLIALVLAWRVIVVGIDAWNERSRALELQAAPPPLGRPGADAELRERIARNPADTRSLLVLALELERQGKRAESAAAMKEALRLAPKDQVTLLQAAGYYLRNGDNAQGLLTLRMAVDAFPAEVSGKVWGVFIAALNSGHHREFFDGVARDNPSWWPQFFTMACREVNVDALQGMFAARAKANVATADERGCLIDRLQRDGHWTNAYVLWLNGLPMERRQHVGYIFNGDFEAPLSNLGFDWRHPPQEGIEVLTETTEGVNGKRALNLTFVNKRWTAAPIWQYLLLPPGYYRFEGRGRTDLETWLGLQWGIYCVKRGGGDAVQLARSDRFVGAVDWTEFRQDFTVSADCPVQMARLELANPKRDAPAPGNVVVRLKGRLWFDDLRVRILD